MNRVPVATKTSFPTLGAYPHASKALPKAMYASGNYVGLPERFYRECRAHCASTVRYMVKGADGLIYHRDWGVYAPYLKGERE